MLFRIIKISITTILCILIFAGLVEFFGALSVYISLPAGVTDPDILYQNTPLFGAIWWGVIFRGPGYMLGGTLPLLIVFLLFEWKDLSNKWFYIAIWISAGFSASLSFAAIPAGFICGLLYWFFVGKYSGKWKNNLNVSTAKPSRSVGRYIAYGLLLFIGYISLGYVWYGYKMLEVIIRAPDRGTPPFISYDEGFRKAYNADHNKKFGNSARPVDIPELGIFHKVALRDFPNASSCMEGAEFASQKYNLIKLGWDKINNESEAEICTFRLLSALGDIKNASPWLESQGFKSTSNFNSKNPYKTNYGTLSVHGNYSIRTNGPKFPTSGFIRRAFGSIPYSMNVVTDWSIDGKKLLFVRYTFNTL